MSRRPRPTGAIHVVTNRRQGKGRVYVSHLLRRSYREGGKVKNETVGNISHLPEELVELVRAGLRGEPVGLLGEGELVLYDVSSSYFEGRCCPLARLGYSRDRRRGTLQIIYGLLCDKRGRPVAVEVFSGELHDDKTLPSQLAKLKTRFGHQTVV